MYQQFSYHMFVVDWRDEMLLVCVVLFCVVFVCGGSRNLEETSPRNCQLLLNVCFKRTIQLYIRTLKRYTRACISYKGCGYILRGINNLRNYTERILESCNKVSLMNL